MSTAKQKLTKDVEIVEAMLANMGDYLDGEVLFGQTGYANLPKLTVGGFLMRQHRLLALRSDLLDQAAQRRLETVFAQFENLRTEKLGQFRQKAGRELEARLRQWAEVLNDLAEEEQDAAAYYDTTVETRAIIEALVQEIQAPPNRLQPDQTEQLETLDEKLRRHWQPGNFVWPDGWQTAYPKATYWWLYGQPR